MDKELFIKFHKSVKQTEILKYELDKDGIMVCGGYESYINEPYIAVQIYDNIEPVAEMLLKDVLTFEHKNGYTEKYFTYDGVRYFVMTSSAEDE